MGFETFLLVGLVDCMIGGLVGNAVGFGFNIVFNDGAALFADLVGAVDGYEIVQLQTLFHPAGSAESHV